MEAIRKIDRSLITKVRNNPGSSGLVFEKYGRSAYINEYTDREITEMIYGIYRDKKMILVDGDYFINLNSVKEVICELSNATYHTKPTIEDFRTNRHNAVSNIRTYYIKDYWLITEEEINNTNKHKITVLLSKIVALRKGRNEFRTLYSISNDYKVVQEFQQGLFPKDLYHPIKRYINGLFFEDDYRISNFKVEGNIKVERGIY